MELELWPRQHDLPPRWDGLPVEWGKWSDTAEIFICPPPKQQRCTHCGSLTAPLMNLGRVWTEPATEPPAIGRERRQHGRQLASILSVFRCPDCKKDHVLNGDERWELDSTDYTDAGSYDIAAPRPGA